MTASPAEPADVCLCVRCGCETTLGDGLADALVRLPHGDVPGLWRCPDCFPGLWIRFPGEAEAEP